MLNIINITATRRFWGDWGKQHYRGIRTGQKSWSTITFFSDGRQRSFIIYCQWSSSKIDIDFRQLWGKTVTLVRWFHSIDEQCIYHSFTLAWHRQLKSSPMSDKDLSSLRSRYHSCWCVARGIIISFSLQWRHNGRDSVSNHQPHGCLLNRLFRRRSKKTTKFRVTGLYAGNSPVTG